MAALRERLEQDLLAAELGAVIVGRSAIVGKPMAALLLRDPLERAWSHALMNLVTLPGVSVAYAQSVIPIGALLFVLAELLAAPEVMRKAAAP